jgi:cardiolipin synthase
VDVRVLVPRHSNHKVTGHAGEHFYRRLLDNGVRIFRWTGRMMHAKSAVIDGVLGIVGSSNLDSRSLFAAHELNVAFRDPTLGRAMRTLFLADVERAEEIDADVWAQRPLASRLVSAIAVLLKHWL